MGNYKFDLGEWLRRLPLSSLEPYWPGETPLYEAGRITSPVDICLNEQLREVVKDKIDWGPAVPVDVFIMAKGEPEDRHVTKIGGLPYRPANEPWPRNDDAEPMTFLAQFCFADSKDLTGDLPGDVLLVFSPTVDYPESLRFEWYPLGLADLVQPTAVPPQPWQFPPCYGHVCRTESFPEAEEKPGYDLSDDLECGGMQVRAAWWLLQYQATQIGRAPFYIQFDNDKNALRGRPLCVINSVEPDLHARYPWVNQSQPLYSKEQDSFDDYTYLSFMDAGCIYISIDENGQLHGSVSCY